MTEKQITITKSSIKAPTNQYDMRRATDDAFTCFFLFYHPSPPLSFKRIHNMTTSLILEFFFSVASLVQQSTGWTHKLQVIVHQVTAGALTSFSWLQRLNAGL